MIGRPTAIVLAAGAGARFGGQKLLASLEGRPVLQHVLDALGAAGIADPVVVVGDDAQHLETAIDWGAARRVRNPDPSRGMASSLKVGWDAAMAAPVRPDAVLVVLGDQPRLDPDVIRLLVEQPADPNRPVVVARHADGARNPVRLEPEAAALVDAASGDRGLGPILDARPALVRAVDVEAANPDVDVRADLVALLARSWAASVRENASQVERVREVPDGRDFYAAVSRTFVADPAREGDPVLDALRTLARPDETWLDIGAGAGRYALPLSADVREVIAIDPSTSMLAALDAVVAAHAIANLRIVEGRWPPDDARRGILGPDPLADVALIAHVGYDIEDIVPFVDAMEAASRRLCAAVLMSQSPASSAAPFWPIVHGEERIALPAMDRFVELLEARGRTPRVERLAAERRQWADLDELLAFLRRQLWTVPGSDADGRLLGALDDLVMPAGNGSIVVTGAPTLEVGLVTWSPNLH